MPTLSMQHSVINVSPHTVHCAADQRIYIYTKVTATSFVFTKSVFWLRKPETVRETTPEILLAEWWTTFAWGLHSTEFYVRWTMYIIEWLHFALLKKKYEFGCFAQLIVKRAVSRDFLDFFSHESNPSGSLMSSLNWFCRKISFDTDIFKL